MMRFSTPVYDKDGQFIGIIVLNYMAKNLIEEFKNIGEYNKGKMNLLDSNGIGFPVITLKMNGDLCLKKRKRTLQSQIPG